MVITNILKSKSLLIIALIVTLSLCFVACGKGADKKAANTPETAVVEAGSLVGTWVYEVPDLGAIELILNEDGTGSSGIAAAMIALTWVADDNTITTTAEGVSSTAPYTLSGNMLTVTTEAGEMTYTRK